MHRDNYQSNLVKYTSTFLWNSDQNNFQNVKRKSPYAHLKRETLSLKFLKRSMQFLNNLQLAVEDFLIFCYQLDSTHFPPSLLNRKKIQFGPIGAYNSFGT